ncbi:MAG: 23S rRNA (adenine(2503)-C(2))-methyltransferase RlmN [Tissierellia bacterium]|jgi:23S rRNA (adenine2503-C2)-methyltransferase|nr:23S rRNA (adenine(2503)-C(2))-methyltransferase RlmN [Tissierellia bacterium]
MNKIYINNKIYRELEEYVISLGLKRFRADQIFRGIHKNGIENIDDLFQISKGDREKIKTNSDIRKIKILKTFNSKIDNTKKMLYLLDDNNIIEGVLMEYHHGKTLCISTQVGCRMGCSFCASTKNGLERNLDSGEIAGQVYAAEKHFNTIIKNIVLMGSGEPFDNYNNVIKALKILNDEKGRNISMRNMTISTCGLANKIIELANEKMPVNLAISIHSFDNDIRGSIMPINKKYNVQELMNAIRKYGEITNNRISFEYTVIPGENDRDEDVELIKKNLSGLNYIVNLIALNSINEYNKVKSKDAAMHFKNKLEKNNINVTLRRELGSDISASCGQLKIHYLKEGGLDEV